MYALTAADYQASLAVVHEVSTTATVDDFSQVALRQVHGLVRADISSLNEVDPEQQRLIFVSEPADVRYADDAPATFARLAAQHPLISHYVDTGDGTARKISDFWTTDVWHGSELFREFYGPIGVEHQMSITLPAPAPIVVGIAANRADRADDFDERDRAVLNLIRPHLAVAWRRAREYERLATLTATASTALQAAGPMAIVLTDPPADLTPGALTALYRFFGRPGSRDPLPARVRRWLDEQADNTRQNLQLPHPLRATLGDRRLIVRYLPSQPGRSLAALLLDEQTADVRSDGLRRVGLTPREADVLALVARGSTNSEVAADLQLSPWTVKRHLANAYAKLGVQNRAAATAAVLDLIGHHQLNQPEG